MGVLVNLLGPRYRRGFEGFQGLFGGSVTAHWKRWIAAFALLFAVCGAVLTGLGTNDPDASVDLQIAGITGTVYTGFAIILAAIAS